MQTEAANQVERPIRVVMVVPPAATGDPVEVLERVPTLTRTIDELNRDGRVVASACCATSGRAQVIERGGARYDFVPESTLATATAALAPDVVHVHGTGFVRSIRRLRAAAPRSALVVQHHGEPPGGWRNRAAHRFGRGRVDAWLFTGADHGQADPFRRVGVVRSGERVMEVLEAASLLSGADPERSADLEGSPVVLWVGRLIESKDPLTALRAFGIAAAHLPDAHLHVLATDRTLEPAVRESIRDLGDVARRVHLHDPVAAERMPAFYAAADVMLSTSRREGSGYSLIEAMTEGCAPVVTGLPSHRSIVGPVAMCFEAGDAAAAAEMLARASTGNGGPTRDLVRRHAADHLSWPAVVERLVDVYREVLRPLGT